MPVGKKALHTGVRTGCHCLICLSVCLSVCVAFVIFSDYVCVAFVIFTDYESCTRPIFTKPGYIEARQYWLARGTCIVACGFELHAVVEILWTPWCVLVGRFFFHVFHEFVFSNSFVDPVSEQPAWTRRRGSDSQPIFPPRTRAHLSPPDIAFSALPPEKFL